MIQMRAVRQVRKKESSLLPATSLHLMQVCKFVEQYLHCQQKYLINLSTAAIHTHLPLASLPQDSFDIDLNVPYIESQHYDSNATFLSDNTQSIAQQPVDIGDENFTDREGRSVQSESEEVSCRQRKAVQLEQEDSFSEERYSEEDFQFIKHANSRQSQFKSSLTVATDPNNSTKESHQLTDKPVPTEEDEGALQLQHLQETAYFLQERQRVERRLLQSHQEQENISSLNRPSKKAIFLSKIEKEKSRKEIAQAINRERHHIKRFLK